MPENDVGTRTGGGDTTRVLTSDTAADRSLSSFGWRPLAARDLPGLLGLYRRALAVDGGQPHAGEEWLLRRWYIDDIEDSLAVFDGERLVGACAWRYVGSGPERRAVIVGQVAPELRRRRIGSRLLDVAIQSVGGAPVRVDSESLTEGADALYRSRSLTCVFAEDVMALGLRGELPGVAGSTDVVLTEWSSTEASRFFAVYEASFRSRPGFPGWSAEEWINRISGDEDFRADLTLLATVDGLDVGFIASASAGWIVQVGVVPAARGRALATRLIVEVLRRMAADGEDRAVLNVNVNNPGAIKAYRRIGFDSVGRRARYEHARLAAPWQPR
jgi:mycothiol synthase